MVATMKNKSRLVIDQYKTFLQNSKEIETNVKPLSNFVTKNDLLPLRKLADKTKCYVCLGKHSTKHLRTPDCEKSHGNIKIIVENFFKRMFQSNEDIKGIHGTCTRRDTLFMMIGVLTNRNQLVPLSCVLFSTDTANNGAFVSYIGTEQDKTFRQVLIRYDNYIGYVIGSGLGTKMLYLVQLISHSITGSNQMYLVCNEEIRQYYKRLGFTQIKNGRVPRKISELITAENVDIDDETEIQPMCLNQWIDCSKRNIHGSIRRYEKHFKLTSYRQDINTVPRRRVAEKLREVVKEYKQYLLSYPRLMKDEFDQYINKTDKDVKDFFLSKMAMNLDFF